MIETEGSDIEQQPADAPADVDKSLIAGSPKGSTAASDVPNYIFDDPIAIDTFVGEGGPDLPTTEGN
jgi:hypothetical protein